MKELAFWKDKQRYFADFPLFCGQIQRKARRRKTAVFLTIKRCKVIIICDLFKVGKVKMSL